MTPTQTPAAAKYYPFPTASALGQAHNPRPGQPPRGLQATSAWSGHLPLPQPAGGRCPGTSRCGRSSPHAATAGTTPMADPLRGAHSPGGQQHRDTHPLTAAGSLS